ncbi:MAG: VCBS repeat-containing protein, partial [Myxococcales bacterium]|nr:VCBS repeat-containing protein [Myxococcales bacterium]
STGSSFGPVYRVLDDFGWVQRGDIADAPRYAADVDGDGLSDVVLFAPEGVLVARSMGIDGWGRPQVGPVTNWVRDFGSQQGWYGRHVRTLGDVNGDGRADVIGYHDDWVRVALSRDFRFDNDFTPLSGGELVTRFEQALDGRCLTASGDLPEGHTCNDARPFGWIATPRGGSTYA